MRVGHISRYDPPTGDLYFDVLTRLGEAASFETVDVEIKEVQGTKVWVATAVGALSAEEGNSPG